MIRNLTGLVRFGGLVAARLQRFALAYNNISAHSLEKDDEHETDHGYIVVWAHHTLLGSVRPLYIQPPPASGTMLPRLTLLRGGNLPPRRRTLSLCSLVQRPSV